MKHTVYVTEPSLIDIPLVERRLPSDSFLVVAGSTSFEDSTLHEYDTLLIRSGTKVTDQIKEYFPYLKHIVRVGTGLDNVDLEFCKRESISVYNAAGANADAVAEYVVTVTLFALRQLHRLSRQDVIDWNRLKFLGSSLDEQTIGLVGFGNVGKRVYKKLSGFNYKQFFVYDPYIDPANAPEGVTIVETVDELIKQSTVVSLHLPLTGDTANLINKEKLSLLAEEAILINSSRGGIVDELAILELLRREAKFTYIADTVVNEPHVNEALLAHERVIITPHLASLTHSANAQMLDVALDNFLAEKTIRIQ